MSGILDYGLRYLGIQGEILDLNNRVTNIENEIEEMRAKGIKVFGVRRSITSTNSEWERVYDSVGMVANATHDGTSVRNDFDSMYPYSEFLSYNYDTTNKKVTAFYGDDTFKFDGTNGLVLTYIPKTYNARFIKDGYEYRLTATGKIHNFVEYEPRSPGRYTMSGDASAVYSKSGVTPFVNKTRANYRTYASAVGDDFSQLDFETISILQHLYLIEYADYNSQSKLGQGRVSTSSAIASGGCDTLGMKSGCLVNDGTASVIYRGFEDIFGNIWQFVDGLNVIDYVGYICKSKNHASFADDSSASPYEKLGYSNLNTNDTYPKNVGCDPDHPLLALPAETGGSSTSGLTDKYWCASGNRIARVGGGWNAGTHAGLFSWILSSDSSVAFADIGARLLRHHI